MPFVSDTFTDADGTNTVSHTGETGATWTEHPSSSNVNSQAIINNRMRHQGGTIAFYASGVPATAEYDVEVDVVVFTTFGVVYYGVSGRADTTADTLYYVSYDVPDGRWGLYKRVAGTQTSLGSYTQALTDGVTYALKLEIRDAAKKVFIDGVERISSADNVITAAGRAGFYGYSEASATATTGIHQDNFTATDVSAAATPHGPFGLAFHGPFGGPI